MRSFRHGIFVSAAALMVFFVAPHNTDGDHGWLVKKVFARGEGGGGGGGGAGGGGEGGGAGGGGAGGGGAGGGGAGGGGAGAGGAGGAGGGGGGGGGDNAEVFNAFLRSPRAMHSSVAPERQKLRVIRSFSNAHGQPCRVVEQTVFIDGRQTLATGTMCRQADGRWALSS